MGQGNRKSSYENPIQSFQEDKNKEPQPRAGSLAPANINSSTNNTSHHSAEYDLISSKERVMAEKDRKRKEE
jgi:hypothetical protein